MKKKHIRKSKHIRNRYRSIGDRMHNSQATHVSNDKITTQIHLTRLPVVELPEFLLAHDSHCGLNALL